MPSNIQVLNIRDFTGGLNLNTDTFKLQDNESPDLLNVDIDGRGGFQCRRGVTPFSTTSLATTPHSMWNYTNSGASYTMVGQGAKMLYSTGTTWTELGTNIGASSGTVGAATVNNTFYWVRDNAAAQKWNGTTLTSLGTSFNNTITPGSGNMPRAQHIAVHSGYTWIAATWESGTFYGSRVRFSWANEFDLSAENWRSDEFIDVDPGKDGDQITAIMPFGDQLLVFKQNSVYAIYGYSSDSFTVVNVSNSVGCAGRHAIVGTPNGVFFFDPKTGLNAYDGRQVRSPFGQIWPSMRDGWIPKTSYANIHLGWINNRVWMSVPWKTAPSDPRYYTFVFDPFLSNGCWTKYDLKAGPFCKNERSTDYLAAIHDSTGVKNLVYKVDVQDQYHDNFGSGVVPINAYYRTKWIDLGQPAVKKRWRRMEAVLQVDLPYELQVETFKDYDPTATIKQFKIAAEGFVTAETNGIWGTVGVTDPSKWDTAQWAHTGQYGEIQKGSSLGVSNAVALKIGGRVLSRGSNSVASAPTFWGVDSLMIKYVPRRVR